MKFIWACTFAMILSHILLAEEIGRDASAARKMIFSKSPFNQIRRNRFHPITSLKTKIIHDATTIPGFFGYGTNPALIRSIPQINGRSIARVTSHDLTTSAVSIQPLKQP
jgi:hypothetical protein